MKRPSKYADHESSLKTFAELFNACRDGNRLVMQTYQTENFRDDGVIVHTQSGKRITFDWEKRDRYFRSGIFKFDTLWQFERKIKKDEIGLSLQCDSDETAVLAAWHKDWLKEPIKTRRLLTDSPGKETARVRETRHFKIYTYSEMKEFREMIYKAIKEEKFESGVFGGAL